MPLTFLCSSGKQGRKKEYVSDVCNLLNKQPKPFHAAHMSLQGRGKSKLKSPWLMSCVNEERGRKKSRLLRRHVFYYWPHYSAQFRWGHLNLACTMPLSLQDF